MHAAMVPDTHHLLSTALPLGPPADHVKTLEAVWRPGPAAFYEPAREREPCGPWHGADLHDVPAQTNLGSAVPQRAPAARRVESCAAPGVTGLYPARTEMCGAAYSTRTAPVSRLTTQQSSLYTASSAAAGGAPGLLGRAEAARLARGGGPYPGRAVPVPAPAPAPLRSSRVSSSSDAAKDLSQPLFVDTTVEYDLPKAAYPPENSEPLLIVHPQYFEHLRHRRTLGDGCACQLCNFYGRRLPLPGSVSAAAPAATASAATSVSAPGPQAFQRPGVPREWPSLHLSSQQQLQQPQPQQSHHQLYQSRQKQQQQQQQQLQPPQPQLLQAPRYNCMFGAGAGVGVGVGVGGETRLSLAPPSVSRDSDSGYSSVELEPAEWCRRPADQARDVLAKRKRRHEPAPTGASQASKRPRMAFWQNGVAAMEVAPFLQQPPIVM